MKSKKEKKKSWTLERIKHGFQQFYSEHSRYPTAKEIDAYGHLPSSRSIQRSFGGLVALRGMLGLDTEEIDLRKGAHSTERAEAIHKRAREAKEEVGIYLVKRFGGDSVRPHFFLTDDHRVWADFFISTKEKTFYVDIIQASSRQNLIGCLNSKLNTYSGKYTEEHPIIFLQMNSAIEQPELDDILANKERKLLKGQYVMDWTTFQVFCEK